MCVRTTPFNITEPSLCPLSIFAVTKVYYEVQNKNNYFRKEHFDSQSRGAGNGKAGIEFLILTEMNFKLEMVNENRFRV